MSQISITSTPGNANVPVQQQVASVTLADNSAATWKAALLQLDAAVNGQPSVKVSAPQVQCFDASGNALAVASIQVTWQQLP